MFRIIIIALLSGTHTQICSAQGTTKIRYNALKHQLKERLVFLDNYNYWNDADKNFDIEKYSEKTAILLTKLLALKELDSITLKEFKNLDLSANTNDRLKVSIYNFGYNCGGSRGWITHPIIQWRGQNGTLHAYNFSKNINCNFHNIHKLKSDLGIFYLMIGHEKGNSSTIQNIGYVIRIDNKNIFTNYKSFVNRAYINLPNTELSFTSSKQILKCMNEEESDEDFLLHLKYIEPTNDTTATNKLLRMFSREYNEPICLKFNNGKFIRLSKCR